MDVYLTTIGCRLNEAELQSWSRELRLGGHRLVPEVHEAQVVIVNTCAVTVEAARKSRKLTRRLHRQNPKAKLVLTGCYAELEPEATAELVGVDLVVNNHDKGRLIDFLQGELGFPKEEPCTIASLMEPSDGAQLRPQGRTRAFVKVQDGCRNRCTFCVVTIARGEERSRPIQEVVEEIRDLERFGHQEVVLTGVHLGGYGADLGTNLMALVREVLKATTVPRVRLSSLEPWDIDPELFSLWSDPRLGRHFHLPLQSGSDAVLRKMARRCDVADFRRLVSRAREAIDDLVLTTDIIVGFPGETEEDWQQTLAFVREIGFSHIHIFAYSPRQGTAAARMKNSVAPELKSERSRELHRLAGELKRDCLERYLGTTRPVLWEDAARAPGRDGAGPRYFSGLTDNYLRCEVEVPADRDLSNQILPARVVEVARDHLVVELDEDALATPRQAAARTS